MREIVFVVYCAYHQTKMPKSWRSFLISLSACLSKLSLSLSCNDLSFALCNSGQMYPRVPPTVRYTAMPGQGGLVGTMKRLQRKLFGQDRWTKDAVSHAVFCAHLDHPTDSLWIYVARSLLLPLGCLPHGVYGELQRCFLY